MSGRLDISAYEVKDPIDIDKNATAKIDIKFQVPEIDQLKIENSGDKIRRAVYESIKKYLRDINKNDSGLEKPQLYNKQDLLQGAIDAFQENDITVDKESRAIGDNDSRLFVHCTIACLDIYRQYYIDAWQECVKLKKFSHRLLRNLQMERKDSHRLLFTAMKVTYSNSNAVDHDVDSVEMLPHSKNSSGAYGQYQNYLKRKKQLKESENEKNNSNNSDDNDDNNDNNDSSDKNETNDSNDKNEMNGNNSQQRLKSPNDDKDEKEDSNDGSSFAMVDDSPKSHENDSMEVISASEIPRDTINESKDNNNNDSNDRNEENNDSDSAPVVVNHKESVFVHSDVEEDDGDGDGDGDGDDDIDDDNDNDNDNDNNNNEKSKSSGSPIDRHLKLHNSVSRGPTGPLHDDTDVDKDSTPDFGDHTDNDTNTTDSNAANNDNDNDNDNYNVTTTNVSDDNNKTQTPKERSNEPAADGNEDETPTPLPDTPEPTVDVGDVESGSDMITPVTPTPATTTPQPDSVVSDSTAKSNNLQNPSKSSSKLSRPNRNGIGTSALSGTTPNDKKQTYEELLKTKQELKNQQAQYKEEINRMEARIHALKWKHERELEAAAANGFDVSKYEELRKSHMSMQIENELMDQTHRQENEQRMRKLEEQLIKQKQEFEKKLSTMQHEHTSQMTKMRRLSQQTIETTKLELQELERQHVTERQQLENQVKALQGSLERESKKDKMIRDLRSEVESLQKKSDGIRDDYEDAISKMQSEFETELNEETNKRIHETATLTQQLNKANQDLVNIKKIGKNYEKQILELKTKVKSLEHLNEHYHSLYKNEKNKVDKLEKQIARLKNNSGNTNSGNNNKNDDKSDESEPPDGKKHGHKRVRSLRKRGSSITIFDDGGQKTIEIVNDGMAPVSENLEYTQNIISPATPAIDEEKTTEDSTNYGRTQSGHNSDSESFSSAVARKGDFVSKKEYERVRDQLQSVSEENDELSEEIAKLNEKIEDLKHQVNVIRENTSEEQMRVKQQLEYQLQRKDVMIERLDAKYDNLSKQMSKELNDKDYLINKLEEDVAAKEEELAAMQTNISYLENQMNSFQSYENNYDEYEDDIMSIEAENEQLLEQQDLLNDELRKTKEELSNLKQALSQKETETAKVQNKVHKHEASIAELESLLQNLEVKKEFADETTAKYNDLLEKLDKLEKENEELTEYKRSSINLNAVQRPSFEAKLALSSEDHGNIKTLQPQMSEKEKMQPQLVMTPTNGIGSVPDEVEDMGTHPQLIGNGSGHNSNENKTTTNKDSHHHASMNENNDISTNNNNNNNNNHNNSMNTIDDVAMDSVTQDVNVNDSTLGNNGARLSVVEEDNVNAEFPNNTRSDAEWQLLMETKVEETENRVRNDIMQEMEKMKEQFNKKLKDEIANAVSEANNNTTRRYEESINTLKKQLEDSRLECEDKQRMYNDLNQEMNRVVESKMQLLENFNRAMNSMRDQLRPSKK